MDSLDIKTYWQLSDGQLTKIYETAKAEGVLGLVAFDTEVDEDCFLLFAQRVEVFGSGFDDQGRPLGFFYLTSFEGSTARLHFCLFKAGRPHREFLGQAVIDWCFKTFEFESLVGVVPSINRGACQYAREMGGQEMGVIPGLCWIDRLKRSVGGVQFVFTKPLQTLVCKEEKIMGGMFKPKIPKQDTSALRAAEEQRKKAKQDAEAAQVKQDAVEEANRQRKKNVSASGRASTLLAGEDSNSLLGS